MGPGTSNPRTPPVLSFPPGQKTRGKVRFMGLSFWYPFLRRNQKPPSLERGIRKERFPMYELKFVRGHVEVYLDGRFCFSADTRGEAEAEIEALTA